MTAVAEQILDQVLALPCEDRVTVAEKLLQSLNSPVQSEIDQAWSEEVERETVQAKRRLSPFVRPSNEMTSQHFIFFILKERGRS